MSTTSVMFSFRDRITQLLGDCAVKALRHELDYRAYCSLPKLTEELCITPAQMNAELQTLVHRGYVTVHEETVFPTWRTLKGHDAFKGTSVEEADAIIARLRSGNPREC